jgi:hypothetical protein
MGSGADGRRQVNGAQHRQWELERWIAWIRLAAVPFGTFQVTLELPVARA